MQSYLICSRLFVLGKTIIKSLRPLVVVGAASDKEPACQYRRRKRHWFDPWVGKIPWMRAWQPTQYSCLENPMDRGARWATVHRVTQSTTEQVSSTSEYYHGCRKERSQRLGTVNDDCITSGDPRTCFPQIDSSVSWIHLTNIYCSPVFPVLGNSSKLCTKI